MGISNRTWRKRAVIMAATAASLALTTAATAYQDMADYTGVYVEQQDRWRAHLVNVAVGSSVEKTQSAADEGVSVASLDYSVGLQSAYEVDMLETEPTGRVDDTVVATRGDRPYAAAQARLAEQQKAMARQVALIAPAAVNTASRVDRTAGEAPQAELAAFSKREAVRTAVTSAKDTAEKAERLALSEKIETAKKGRFSPTEFTVKKQAAKSRQQDGVRGSILAYAPAEEPTASPFDAILQPETGPEMAVAEPIVPTKRPKYVAPKTNGKIRLSKADHKWAAKPLPRHAFSKKERKCLATGIYFEARGEPTKGQQAVAQVILNRVRAPAFPNTICGVVYHNQHMRNACQFSFTCDGIRDYVGSKKHWRRAQNVANAMIDGKVWLKEVGSSTHYHADYVSPRWRRAMTRLDKIGRHIFYRTKNGGWG